MRVHGDGRVERFYGTETTPPSFDAATRVTSKDVVIDHATGVFARLYVPACPATEHKKLPVLVYYHGGGLVLDSTTSPMYHRCLNSVVSNATVLAVSVNYRLAPEHLLPVAYDDSWAALTWAASGADPWLSEHGDTGRIFLAGNSGGGANIVHNMAIMAGVRHGLSLGALVEGAIVGAELRATIGVTRPRRNPVKSIAIHCSSMLQTPSRKVATPAISWASFALHPVFSGKEPVDGEAEETREKMEKLWSLICPQATEGMDDPRLNPMAHGAPSLQNLACRKLLVCSAERDHYARARALAYYQAVKESGWRGSVEWLESKEEEHVFFLHKPECDESLALMDRVVAFLASD